MNHKRTRPRTKGLGCGREAPAHWNILFHSRPRRRSNRANCHKILLGFEPDSLDWPLGNRKPHQYYW